MLSFTESNKLIATKITFTTLPEDVLHLIALNLELSCKFALRGSCRQIYFALPDNIVLATIYLGEKITSIKFQRFFAHLLATDRLRYVRLVTFYRASISVEAVILLLGHCENIQHVSILGCKNIALEKLIRTLVHWQKDKSGRSLKPLQFKGFEFTRCVGGRRHSLLIKKINQDLLCLENGKGSDPSIVFRLSECDDINCEQCSLRCGGCNVRYKYWDEFWIQCVWCRKRQFCGDCFSTASTKNPNKICAFQFMRVKLCQLFELECSGQ